MSDPNNKRRRCDSPRNEPGEESEANKLLYADRDNQPATAAAAIPLAEPAMQESCVLPPEIWAHALDYLLFTEVAKTALVSKSFLNDVVPLIRFLYLDWDRYTTCKSLKRFKRVEEIVIDCLFERLIRRGRLLRITSSIDAFVLLLASLETLKQVFVGIGDSETKTEILQRLQLMGNPAAGYRHNDILRPGNPYTSIEDPLRSLMKSLCAAYNGGFVSPDLMIHGLPAKHGCEGRHCETCKLICSSFPIQQVSTLSKVKNGYFPLQLESRRDDDARIRIKAVLERKGGKEILKDRETELLCALVKMTKFTTVVGTVHSQPVVLSYPDDVLQAISLLKGVGCHVRDNVTVEAFFGMLAAGTPNSDFEPPTGIKESVYQTLLEVGFPVDNCDLQVIPDDQCRDCPIALV